ncbi:MAG: class I SAM-dependent methyltransferase [Acidimicrobiales bacterium]
MGRRSQELVDYERVAALYEEGRALPAQVLARWGDAVRPYLPAGTRRLLDLGAGTGIFARAWPGWTHATVVALEPSAAMILAVARKDPGVTFIRGVAEDLPLRHRTMNVVWISTALHHFADLDRALAEIERVLDPAGRVLVRTYAPGRTEMTWADEFPGRAKWQTRFHTEHELATAFEGHGFELIDSRDVLEWTETYADSARWVTRMRHADSMLTALTDEEIDAGTAALRSQPSKIGQLEVTLFVFGHRPQAATHSNAPHHDA